MSIPHNQEKGVIESDPPIECTKVSASQRRGNKAIPLSGIQIIFTDNFDCQVHFFYVLV